jgi:antitoxin VapB
MVIHVDNSEAAALIRELAALEGVTLDTAIVMAMREALARRSEVADPLKTAERLRIKYGVELLERTRLPLSRDVYNEMWEKG